MTTTLLDPVTSAPETCAEDGCAQRTGLLREGGPRSRLLCAWHDPVRRALREQRKRDTRAAKRDKATPRMVGAEDLPVSKIESLDDAMRLAAWVPVAIATGVLGGREASAMVSSIREYRMAYADAGLLARLEALEERIRAAKRKGLDV